MWPVLNEWSQTVILAPCNYPWSSLGPWLAQISPPSYASPTSDPADKKKKKSLEVEECHPLPTRPIISSHAALQPAPCLGEGWGCCGWMREVRRSQALTNSYCALQLQYYNTKYEQSGVSQKTRWIIMAVAQLRLLSGTEKTPQHTELPCDAPTGLQRHNGREGISTRQRPE